MLESLPFHIQYLSQMTGIIWRRLQALSRRKGSTAYLIAVLAPPYMDNRKLGTGHNCATTEDLVRTYEYSMLFSLDLRTADCHTQDVRLHIGITHLSTRTASLMACMRGWFL